MKTVDNEELIGQTVCPFREGEQPGSGGVFWGAGITQYRPDQVFSCLTFYFNSGDANNDGSVNGVDVVSLVNFFKGQGDAPVPILAGDTNGNCQTNGLDVIYLVNYFKGLGPEPIQGNCP